MVSGNLAVFDSDALRMADFIRETTVEVGGSGDELYKRVVREIEEKKPGEIDGPNLAYVKKIIRRTEARSAALTTGVKNECIHFLDLPFYDTGKATKKPLSQEDVGIVE